METCGVTDCLRSTHGLVPDDSPLQGERVWRDKLMSKDGKVVAREAGLRLRVCLEHGWEHHRLWLEKQHAA